MSSDNMDDKDQCQPSSPSIAERPASLSPISQATRILQFSPVGTGDDNTANEEQYKYIYETLGLNRFSHSAKVNADEFLKNLLRQRGYATLKSPAIQSEYKRPIQPHELESYSKALITSIGNNDFSNLADIYRTQSHLLACNRFGESTLHLAARKSNHRVVRFILEVEDCPIMIDDYGRSPLTDAMWAVSPSFAVIELLMNKYPELISLTDVRGFTPLSYIRQEHVFRLCLFLYSKRDQYWPISGDEKQEQVSRVVEHKVSGSTGGLKRKLHCEDKSSAPNTSTDQPPTKLATGVLNKFKFRSLTTAK
jgi:hypothetical protein